MEAFTPAHEGERGAVAGLRRRWRQIPGDSRLTASEMREEGLDDSPVLS